MEIALFCFTGIRQIQFCPIKVQQIWFSWFVGLLEMSSTLGNPYCWLWLCRSISKSTSQHHQQNMIWGNLKFSRIVFGGRRCVPTEKSLRSVLSDIEKFECGINIFQKTWNWNLVISIKGVPLTTPHVRNQQIFQWICIQPQRVILEDGE